MREKIKILSFSFLIFGFMLNAQNPDLPPNPKAGKCYIKCLTKKGTTDWKAVKCEYLKLDAKTLQPKLKKLGYDVDLTNGMDFKTITAYKQYLKDEKKRLRGERKLKRRNKKSK